MQTIDNLKMFELEAVNPYATPIKAQYIERTVTPIFGGDDKAAEPAADTLFIVGLLLGAYKGLA